MKKLVLALFATILGTCAIAQNSVATEEVKKEIKKEVIVKEVNGEKVLTIITSENGISTEEIFKGEAAEKKLADIEKENAKDPAKREAAKKEEYDRKMKMVEESGKKNL